MYLHNGSPGNRGPIFLVEGVLLPRNTDKIVHFSQSLVEASGSNSTRMQHLLKALDTTFRLFSSLREILTSRRLPGD